MIPDSFIQDLLARVDIVDLVDSYVPLKKSGANYAACCPFHSEKSPSFTVSPTKQFYHCFGCGAHGTAIGFVMEYQGIGFIDAVKELASRAGMQVPESEGRGSGDDRPGQARALIERRTRIDHRLQRLIVDVDFFRGVLGLPKTLGHDHGDADVDAYAAQLK